MPYNSWDEMNGTLHLMESNQMKSMYQAQAAADDARYAAKALQSTMDSLHDTARETARDTRKLREASELAFDTLIANSNTLNTITSQGFSKLADALSQQQETLTSIDQAIRNPRAVAAAELFRVGLELLRAELLEEAESSFVQSLEQDNIQPMAWFALGITRAASGRNAFEEFTKAHRYAKLKRDVFVNSPTHHSLPAGILLLAASQAVNEEQEVWAIEAIESEVFNDHEMQHCAELWLTLARLQAKLGRDASQAISYTMRLAPEYAAITVYEDLPGAREAAEKVYHEPMIQSAVRLAQIEDELTWGQTFYEKNNLRTGTRTVGDRVGEEWRLERDDVRAYDDITYTFLRYRSIYAPAMFNVQNREESLQPGGMYSDDNLRKAEAEEQQLLGKLAALDQEYNWLQSSLSQRPGVFAKAHVKADYALRTAQANKRLAEIAQETPGLAARLAEVQSVANNLRAYEPERQEKVKLIEEWLETYPKSGVYRVHPFKLG